MKKCNFHKKYDFFETIHKIYEKFHNIYEKVDIKIHNMNFVVT